MMRRLLLTLALLSGWAAAQEKLSCTTHCHGKEATAFLQCVHEGELTCLDCHGGDPAAERDKRKAHDPKSGYRGTPARGKIPELCGSCHSDPLRMHAYALPTDQIAHYRTSKHGRALEKGDLTAAVCTDCHGVHRILPAHDPRATTARANQPATCGKCHSDPVLMKSRGLPADSVKRFRNSSHGIALLVEGARGAPSCADCHGAHGATPPGVGELVQVCGHCHINTAQHFRSGPHADEEKMRCRACHEETGPEYTRSGCASCHGAHSIAEAGAAMYSGSDVGRCGHCHREKDAAAEVIQSIRDGRTELIHAMAQTKRRIREAKQRGLFIEYERLYLRESERALVLLQPLSHSVDPAAISKHLEDGLARQDRTRERLETKLVVLRDRRLLLFGLALILVILAALMAAKLAAVRRLS